MSCYHPLLALDLGPNRDKCEWKGFNGIDGEHRTKTRFVFIENNEKNRQIPNAVEIPCGKCIGCRLDYARKWANRCKAESQYHDQNWFLTITYDDVHLPIGKYGNPTLDPEGMTKFLKRLRKKFGDGIKYFYCGEYGGQTFRPHYHMILFVCNLNDVVEWFPFITEEGKQIAITKKSKSGQKLFYSPELQECWKQGEIQIGEVRWNSCEYVARYVMKKASPEFASNVYDILGVHPEFLRMSRRPGIGFQYYQDHKDVINKTDEIYLPGKDGAIRSNLTGYYRKQQIKDNEENGCLDHFDKSLKGFRSGKDHVQALEKLSGLHNIENVRAFQENDQKRKMLIFTRK